MNLDTFTKLLEAYGTIESKWPAEMRAEARQFLQSNQEASALIERYAPLDGALEKYAINPQTARIRIAVMARIGRKSVLDRITSWLLPEPGNLHAIWRPALAATLPLVLGIILGSTLSLGSTDTSTDTWSDEMSLVALSSNDSESLP